MLYLKGKLDGPIWLTDGDKKKNEKSGYNEEERSRVNATCMGQDKYLDRLSNRSEASDFGIIYGNHARKGKFFYEQAGERMQALVICRADPILPPGIKTLNLIFDPSKSDIRKQKISKVKAQYDYDFGQMDIEKSYEKLFELLWYTRLPCFDVKGITSKQKDDMSVIKRCYWRSQLVDCASIFVTRSTDRGMCCAFNQVNADRIFKNTSYLMAASSMQRQDKKNSFMTTNLTTRYNITETLLLLNIFVVYVNNIISSF